MGNLEPTYDDCPVVCPDSPEVLPDYCETCPHRQHRDGFKEDCEMYLNERIGDGWKKWGFETLYQDALTAFDLEESPNLTITAARCVGIITSERGKMRRRDEWKARQKK